MRTACSSLSRSRRHWDISMEAGEIVFVDGVHYVVERVETLKGGIRVTLSARHDDFFKELKEACGGDQFFFNTESTDRN